MSALHAFNTEKMTKKHISASQKDSGLVFLQRNLSVLNLVFFNSS